ncbi:glutathione peroxidase [uncultured Bifidobacterium sp.]|uniref:glutathione peroxidase n=1 Tax=uncultured Bifidobacterium sp. TaxID=165187 RepID=UPI0028DC9E1D|nr:glutathione peroxidase [uncultured Bifidobacterium sp.]
MSDETNTTATTSISAATATEPTDAYGFTVLGQDGERRPLSDWRGKVLLIVNTATGCGFTPQYEGLEALYEKYRDRGFEILDFPCNQFAGQAPGSDEEIHSFCVLRYDASFPQFSKIKVNGKEADPLYVWLKKQPGAEGRIRWNFTKFLVDRQGHVVERFASRVTPEQIDPKVAGLL